MNASDIVTVAFLIALGLVVGSFLNVIIFRLPVLRDEPDEMGSMYRSRPWGEVLGGRSRCAECDATLGAADLIPVFSWLALRGRCRSCGASIGAFHLVAELAVPALWVVAWAVMGWGATFAVVAAFVVMAVPLAVIDMRTYTLPKALVWPGTALVVAVTLLAAVLAGDLDMIVKALVGTATVSVPLFVIWFIHPTGQGFGDVRLSVVLGWVVGATSLGDSLLNVFFRGWICLFIAAMLGIVAGIPLAAVRGLRTRIPFGPFLALGGYICAVGAEWISV